LKPGGVGDPVGVSSGQVVVQFLSSSPGGPLPLEKVKDRVQKDWSRKVQLEQARKMIAAAGGGTDIETLARKLKVELKNEGPVTRAGPFPDLGDNPEASSRLFSLKPGEMLDPVVSREGVTLVKLVSHTDPLEGFDAQKEALRETLLSAKRDRLFRAYVERLRSGTHVEINTTLVNQVDRT
jgi:parvulin-like peptidyl-prolyl isomerase